VLHRAQPEAAGRLPRISSVFLGDSVSVVPHRQLEGLPSTPEAYLNPGGLSVPRGVVDRLLGDPIEVGRRLLLFGQLLLQVPLKAAPKARLALSASVLSVGPSSPTLAKGLEGPRQGVVLQACRHKLRGEVSNGTGSCLHRLDDLVEVLGAFLALLPQPVADQLDLHDAARDP